MKQPQRNPGQKPAARKAGAAQKRKPASFTLGAGIDPAAAEFTVVFCGSGPGAAFPVAAAARALGLEFGSQVNAFLNNEELANATPQSRPGLIRMRNATMPVWAWKIATAEEALAALPHLRNPRVVYVWQDPMAAALGRSDPAVSALSVLRARADAQLQQLEALAEAALPIMVVSMEQARAAPRRFAHALAAFVGRKLPEQLGPVLAPLRPKRKAQAAGKGGGKAAARQGLRRPGRKGPGKTGPAR